MRTIFFTLNFYFFKVSKKSFKIFLRSKEFQKFASTNHPNKPKGTYYYTHKTLEPITKVNEKKNLNNFRSQIQHDDA